MWVGKTAVLIDQVTPGLGLKAPTYLLTSGGLQPFLFHTVTDLGFRVALRKVTGDDGRVPLVYFNHMLYIQLEVLEICREREGARWASMGREAKQYHRVHLGFVS